MASIKFLILLTVQVTFTLAAAPLKCFLRQSEFLNIFSKTEIPATFYDEHKTSPLKLEPMIFDDIRLNQDDLQFSVKQAEYKGFNDAIVDEFGVNFNTNLTRIFFHADVSGQGFYNIGGSLFSVPISGEGPCSLFFKKLQIEMVMPFEIVADKIGQKYIELKKFYFWQDISSNGEIIFGNLYNGNKELSDAMHSLINQNLRIIGQQFGKPFMTRIVGHIFNVFRNYMLSLPLRDFTTC